MNHEAISHVTPKDIIEAKALLENYLANEDNIYSAM